MPLNSPSIRINRRLSVLISMVAIALNVISTNSSMAQDATVVQELNADNWDDLVPPGKEVDAIYGDTTLQNRYLRAVIAQPVATRNANMTVRNIGGCLIDLTRRNFESDQLSAFYPGRRVFAFSDLKTGDGSVTVSAEGSDSKAAYSVIWSLPDDAQYLTAKSVWTNTTKADIIESLAAAFEQGNIRILDDAQLIAELQAYEVDRLPSGMVRYSAPEGMHDDCVMSLSMAWKTAAPKQLFAHCHANPTTRKSISMCPTTVARWTKVVSILSH